MPFLFSCKGFNTSDNSDAILTLNIERGLQNLTKRNLSDFTSNIRYIQLETTENSLIGNTIQNIFVEENKIFVHHNSAPFLKVFDANTGKYLYNIGGRGQGPGELPYLNHVDINVKEKQIILGWRTALKFDFEGKFLGNIILPELPDSLSSDLLWNNVVMFDKNVFSVGAYTVSDHQFNAIYVFDKQGNIVNTLTSYDQFTKHPTSNAFSPHKQIVFHYRDRDYIYFYRGLSDTIYAYNHEIYDFEPYLAFNFGKHRSPRNPGGRYFSPNHDEIYVQRLSESERYVFIDFFTIKASTEPFEDYFFRDGVEMKLMNHSMYAIFDKQERDFQFLLQPIKGIKGLVNDLDNGIPFFPKSISSSGKMVDWLQAFRFIEYVEKLPNPDESFLEVLQSVNEDDNPIVIIASPQNN
jgi:hypothetical protein